MSDQTEQTYFEKRMSDLGLTSPDQYTITNHVYGSFARGQDGYKELKLQLFSAEEDGSIRIYYPTLEGLKAQYKTKDSRIAKDYFITRLKDPKGDRKYNLPKGAGTFPFLGPSIIDKYQKKTPISTLILTEGAFKAFKGSMHGLDIIGLTSITHAKDRITQGLHEDIREIIIKCKVKRVIWLVDGDCNRLSSRPIDQIEDLYTRPHQFYKSATSIKTFLDEFEDLEKWFIHPLSDELEDLGNPKGLDDLLIAAKDNEEEVIKDLMVFHKRGNFKYFHKINMTYGHGELYRYFKLSNVDEFYTHHAEKRKDLRTAKDFVFNGTRYRWNEEKTTCETIVPADAKNYFRVGDQYHEKIKIPNKYGELEQTFHRRMKSTIVDDHKKEFIAHIKKFKAFCNKPDHQNYQEVIHNCYNVYGPFEHEADEGECSVTLEFLQHIFGTNDIKYTHPKFDELQTINEFDLGLDYIQLLYKEPTQILPIICLVSRENGTGKSTFAKWLKMMFTQNVAIVGNADLANDFNASWASKLLVICDEAKIDKQVVIEKVKALSTADKIFMNAKGKDQIEIDFFAKFILLTNNEENFIYANEEDVRYWVRKVPVIEKMNTNLLSDMYDEIPAFLHYLNQRKLKTECLHRAWFTPDMIRTEALMRVIANSRPTIEKEIRAKIREMFFDFGEQQILFTASKLNEEFFKNKYESNYLLKILREDMKLEMKTNSLGKLSSVRYDYPKWSKSTIEGEMKMERIRDIGRPFIFPIEKFLSKDEISNLDIDPEIAMLNKHIPAAAADTGDLPF